MLLYILQVQLNLLLHNHLNIVLLRIISLLHQLILITELDAGWVCDTWTNIQYMHLLRCPVIDIVPHFWSWAHQRHIPKEYINQLWQLIKLKLPDKVSTLRNTRVMTTNSHKASLISPYPHRAELKYPEVLVLVPHSHLSIKHRSFRVQLNPDSKYQKERTEYNQSQSARYDIK